MAPESPPSKPARKAGRPKGRAGEESKEAILLATIRLIGEQGMAISLADIAREADTSKTSVLHHFGSREGLFQAIAARAHQAFTGILTQTPGDWSERLDAQLALHFRPELRTFASAMQQLMASAMVNDGHAVVAKLSIEHRVNIIQEFLGLPEEVGRPAAEAITALGHGAEALWLGTRRAPEIYREMTQFAVRAIVEQAQRDAAELESGEPPPSSDRRK